MADRDEDNDDDLSSETPSSKARSKRERDDEDEAPRPKKKLAKNTRKGAKADERKPRPSERAKEREKEREKYRAKKPEGGSSSTLIWVGLAAAVALGAWWILRGQGSSSAKEETPPARSETPTAETPPTKPEVPAAKTDEPTPKPEAPAPSASAAPEPSAAPPTPPTSAGGAFDKGVALDALAKTGAKAAGCRMRGESGGTANVTVTFEPSGKVKDAEIRSGAFSGSPTGKCIIRKLMETTIPSFTGDSGQVIAPVSVR